MSALDVFEALTFAVGAAYFAYGVACALAARRARASDKLRLQLAHKCARIKT